MGTVIILGGGPAGAITGWQLARYGHEVTIVTSPGSGLSIEGVSQRVAETALRLGLSNTLDALGMPASRTARWGNRYAEHNNGEYIVERAAFNQALLQDARNAGLKVIEARVRRETTTEDCGIVDACGEAGQPITLRADFIVEGRGRKAPRGPGREAAGPTSIALIARISGCAPGQPKALLLPVDRGWIWCAAGKDGRGVFQLYTDRNEVPGKAQGKLRSAIERRLAELSGAMGFFGKSARFEGEVLARGAGSYLHRQLVDRRLIRVGDAAFTMDPLSGHGIYEGVSGGLVAAAVVNTILRRPGTASLASRFYRARQTHRFWRSAAVARTFYRIENEGRHEAFWQARASWPGDNTDPPFGPIVPRVKPGAVVRDGFVEPADVVIAPRHPNGVAFVEGVPLVPLLRAISANVATPLSLDVLAGKFKRNPVQVSTAWAWLWQNRLTGILPPMTASQGENAKPPSDSRLAV